jgi:ABC-type glutathione transport system ATPase component
MEKRLQIKNLNIAYGKTQVVHDFSDTLLGGEIVCIVGESGSGKTTLLHAILRSQSHHFHIPSGEIVFKQNDLCLQPEKELKKIRGTQIGIVSQNPLGAFNPMRKIEVQFYETLQSDGKGQRAKDKIKILELFKKLDLPDGERILNSYPFELSGGMNQRVAIALSMMLEPCILLADEPTSALDVTSQVQVAKELRHLRDEFGTSILMVTHNLALAGSIADRIIIMNKGCVVEKGSVQEVFDNPKHPYTKKLLASLPTIQPKQATAVFNKNHLYVSNLSKTYTAKNHKVLAVKNANLTLHKGEILGIVGESRSGKSTLVRQIIHLEEATDGVILLEGQDITKLDKKGRFKLYQHMQMVFQMPVASFDARKTIGQTIEDTLRNLRGMKKKSQLKATIGYLMQDVGLEPEMANRYPFQLSGGQCQRAAIARALSVAPELLICDEATSALDVTSQAEIIELLLHFVQKHDMSMIFVSHDLALVSQLCDRIIVMKDGSIVECGKTEDVINHSQNAYTKKLLGAALKYEKTSYERDQIKQVT